MILTATYNGKKIFRGDRDNMPSVTHVFTNCTNDKDVKQEDITSKDIQLIKKTPIVKGKEYKLTLDEIGIIVAIEFNGEKYFKKNNNSIIHIDNKGRETNLSYSQVIHEMGKQKGAYTIKQKKSK